MTHCTTYCAVTGVGACRIWGMQLPLVVIAFLVLAVLLAVGILVVVAVPRLKGPEVSQDRESADQRHSSRTGR